MLVGIISALPRAARRAADFSAGACASEAERSCPEDMI